MTINEALSDQEEARLRKLDLLFYSSAYADIFPHPVGTCVPPGRDVLNGFTCDGSPPKPLLSGGFGGLLLRAHSEDHYAMKTLTEVAEAIDVSFQGGTPYFNGMLKLEDATYRIEPLYKDLSALQHTACMNALRGRLSDLHKSRSMRAIAA